MGNVPPAYWDNLVELGFEFVWLMGVWQTTESSIDRYCFHPDLVSHYDRVAPDWQGSDVWGSPYAIEDYRVHSRLGDRDDLLGLKEKLNNKGLKLILDFVPNHFNGESELLAREPGVFMQGSEADLQNDPTTYYTHAGKVFAHGRDPHFPAWSDTVQVNYYEPEAQSFMLEKLRDVATLCDGVRCDMAMLMLPDIFHQTWQRGNSEPADFWSGAIADIKRDKDFVFIAEAYWDREAQLQQKGFDYCYDKNLLDLLLADNHEGIHHHLDRGLDWFGRAITFLENHDEERSLSSLGFEKSRAAAVIAGTLPGLHLFFDGQFTGARHRVPVQLALEAQEHRCVCSMSQDAVNCSCQEVFYESLTSALKHPAFAGDWQRVDAGHFHGYASFWSTGNTHCLICTNYGPDLIQVNISCSFAISKDLLNQVDDPDYVSQEGEQVQIELPPYRSVILI